MFVIFLILVKQRINFGIFGLNHNKPYDECRFINIIIFIRYQRIANEGVVFQICKIIKVLKYAFNIIVYLIDTYCKNKNSENKKITCLKV